MSSQILSSANRQGTRPHLFLLPNGNPLRYFYPGDEKSTYRTFDTPYARRHSAKRKERSLRLEGWSSGSSQYLVFADFDTVPCGFASYDSLYSYLQHEFGRKSIVFRSNSNKCKVAFVVETPSDVELTWQASLDTLEWLLPEELFTALDRSDAALRKSYLTPESLKLINSRLTTLDPIPCVLDSLDLSHIDPLEGVTWLPGDILGGGERDLTCTTNANYRVFEGEIDQRFRYRGEVEETFIRFLLATVSLVTEQGFDISQTKLGHTLGISQQAAGKWIQKYIQGGKLQEIDCRYIRGKKAKTYKASGILHEALIALYSDEFKTMSPLPLNIAEGNWNQILKKVASHNFRNRPDKFLDWASGLEGIELKDRMKQAKRLSKWLQENRSKGDETHNHDDKFC